MLLKKYANRTSAKMAIIVKMHVSFEWHTTLTARKAEDARTKGTNSFSRISAVIVNGLKTVRKLRTHIGSKELMLAMFPVPKKPMNMNASCGFLLRKTLKNSRKLFILIQVIITRI